MNPQTEAVNQNTNTLDLLSSEELVKLFIQEDSKVIEALKKAQIQIARAVDLVTKVFTDGERASSTERRACLESPRTRLATTRNRSLLDVNEDFEEECNAVIGLSGQALSQRQADSKTCYEGPRLVYMGAGTSGRLGVLDASECPPTFSSHPDMVQGIIAGGDKALRVAVEGAEDDEQAGFDWVTKNLNPKDILIGISASGSTPYVLGALKSAKSKGITCIAIANNEDSKIFGYADHHIWLDTGAEILSGSTRLKAGTSQKLVLNIISTSLMVKLGKSYGNLMVDVQATNQKLVKRAISLVMQITNTNEEVAESALRASNMRVKHAVLKILKNLDYDSAETLLIQHGNSLRDCITD